MKADGGWGVAGLLAGAAAIAVATWAAASQGVSEAEAAVARWAFDLPDAVTPVLEVVMQAGVRPAPVLVAAAVAAVLGWRWRALGVAVSGLLAWWATWAAKAVVGRPRPDQATLERTPHDLLDGNGFPSTHAAIAAATVASLILLGRSRRPAAAALVAVAALTALARVHLGLHWPLDVVGGAAIGVALAVVVSLAVGLPPTGPIERAGGEGELVVASFNVRNGRAFDGLDSWPFRARRTARAARALGADILAVQEAFAFQSRFLGAALPGYERVGRGRGRRGGEWCAVYVRDDRLRVVESTTHWYGPAPERPGSRVEGAAFPRIATHVRLALLDTGQELELVNTHLDARSSANREASVEQLLGWLSGDLPALVVGDLNATRARDPGVFERLATAGLVDALPDDRRGTAHDFRGGTDHNRLDHVFVSSHWQVLDACVVADDRTRRLPSDHWPVVATLRLAPSA